MLIFWKRIHFISWQQRRISRLINILNYAKYKIWMTIASSFTHSFSIHINSSDLSLSTYPYFFNYLYIIFLFYVNNNNIFFLIIWFSLSEEVLYGLLFFCISIWWDWCLELDFIIKVDYLILSSWIVCFDNVWNDDDPHALICTWIIAVFDYLIWTRRVLYLLNKFSIFSERNFLRKETSVDFQKERINLVCKRYYSINYKVYQENMLVK